MNNRLAFVTGFAVSALAFGCVAAVASHAEEAPAAPAPVIDAPAVELEATVVPAPVVVGEAPAVEEETPAPVVTTDPLPLEEAITLEETPAEEAPAAPAPLTYEETVALFGESFAVGDVIVCPEGWTVATDTTAEGFHWAACM